MGNDLFRDASFDTIFHTGDGSYYVFKGSNYWKLTEDSVESGYPRKISEDWPGLPNNINAAVTWTDNKKTYFFKGDQYWKFDNMQPVDGYPKDISVGFAGIPNNVDAAFVWGGNGKIYFFKDDEYWKFDPSRNPRSKVITLGTFPIGICLIILTEQYSGVIGGLISSKMVGTTDSTIADLLSILRIQTFPEMRDHGGSAARIPKIKIMKNQATQPY